MVLFIGAGKIKEDKIQEVEEAIQAFMPYVREEEGTVEYHVYRGANDPTLLVFYERYRDEAAQQEHRTAHGGEPLQAMMRVLRDALEGPTYSGNLEEIASK